MLVAPLDANTLAKLANGICDNLLVSNQRVLSPPSVRLSDLSFMETLVLLQRREHSDLHVLLPLHTLLSVFLWYGPLFLLNHFFFPSLNYIPFHSSAPSLPSIISQSLLCAFPAFSDGWYFSLSTSTLCHACAHRHMCAYTLALTFEFLSAFFRCNLERHL